MVEPAVPALRRLKQKDHLSLLQGQPEQYSNNAEQKQIAFDPGKQILKLIL